MDNEWGGLFSVDEILGGLPSRRASGLLYAIEGRTAYLVARARRAMAPDFSGRSAEQEEHAFLTAFSSGTTLPIEPTVQDLERYARDWASLVPENPSIRASLARLIGEQYRLPRSRTANIQQALGTSSLQVATSFQELHAQPIDTIFVSALSAAERLNWLRSRFAEKLEGLPPFWISFSLTLTETVGAGILALPIAFANIGPMGGIALLLILGLINMLTIGAMAEAVARNGNVRYGHAYFGRLVQDYLGKPGLLLLTPAILILYFTILFAYSIGFASTLTEAVGFSPVAWVLLLLMVVLFFLRKKSLDATVASSLVIGFCSIFLIAILIVLALPHVTASNLRHSEIPLMGDQPFDASVLELVFGVVLLSLFGHTSTANCAAVVLDREPSGKAFIKGSMAALAAAMVLYVCWVFAVNGAVGPEQFAGVRGTALTPLASVAGSSIHLAGSIFAVLSMGMASVHVSWGAVKTVSEWLPPATTRSGASAVSFSPSNARLSHPNVRQVISLSPVISIFLLALLLLAFDKASFSEPLGFLGVITVPIVSGVFAMLMLTAARRKGDCLVACRWRLLGHPVVVSLFIAFFLTAIFVHGLVIWSTTIPRVAALVVGCILIIFILISVRAGEFIPRAVAQVRYEDDRSEKPAVELVSSGEAARGAVHFGNSPGIGEQSSEAFAGLINSRRKPERHIVEITLDAPAAREMKVWVHQLTAEGVSRTIPARLTHNDGSSLDLEPLGGKIVLSINGDTQALRIVVEPTE